MGRNNKAYVKTLHQQVYERLNAMQAFGESKKEAIKSGTADDKIFSYNTYKAYYKHCKYFVKYIQEKHPGITTLKKAREHVPAWLESRAADPNISSWTLHLEAKAVGKLFGIKPEDPDYWKPPERARDDIKRSRNVAVRDAGFDRKKNAELINFCQGVGPRLFELRKMKGGDLYTKEDLQNLVSDKKRAASLSEDDKKTASDSLNFFPNTNYFVRIKGKGGRVRFAPIIGDHQSEIVERFRSVEADENVWRRVHTKADIHSFRADYCVALYKSMARKIDDIPFDRVNSGTGHKFQSDVFVCRKDQDGMKFDKAAMRVCSCALGHTRVSVVAENYLWQLRQ